MKTLIPFLILCLVSICNAQLRTWTAVNGKEVEAEFVSNEKGVVKLKLKSGKVFEVPANKLSKEDNALISSLAGTDEINDNELTMDQVLKIANQPHQPIADIPQLITATLRVGMWERETIINIHDSSFQGSKKIIKKSIARIKHAHGKYVVFEAYDEEGNKFLTEVHSYSSKTKKLLSVGVSSNGDVTRMVGTPNLKNLTVDWDKKSSQSNETVQVSITCNKDGMGAQIKGSEKLEGKVKASWSATAKWTSELPDSKNTKNLKLTDKQISKHLGFWIGKWVGHDKSTNQIFDQFECKWKEEGKSLTFNGIGFENGEKKDTYKGTSYFDKDLNTLVETLNFEKSGVVVKRHLVLDAERGLLSGFPVEPQLPEGIGMKYEWATVDQNNVDFTMTVTNGEEILDHKEVLIKRQIGNSEKSD